MRKRRDGRIEELVFLHTTVVVEIWHPRGG
jgi:hypothetical protein